MARKGEWVVITSGKFQGGRARVIVEGPASGRCGFWAPLKTGQVGEFLTYRLGASEIVARIDGDRRAVVLDGTSYRAEAE